jgi:hypothetical protein
MILKMKLFFTIFFVVIFFAACTKENSGSVPTGPASSSGIADFTLAGAPGNCTDVVVSGAYNAGIAASNADSALITVDVDSIGSYLISTNTENGISFNASGSFTRYGTQFVGLKASGRPIANGTFTYTIGTNGCSFTVIVKAVNDTSSSSTAVYTLSGIPNACAAATVGGTYKAGTALNSSNTVTFSANVTTVGSYTISTAAVNGISFSGSGTFASTGTQTITLTGTGTPLDSGTSAFSIAGANCSTNIKIVAGSSSSSSDCKACTYYPTCVGTTYTTTTTSPTITVPDQTSTILAVADTTISGAAYKKLTAQTGAVYINCDNGVCTLITYNATSVQGGTASEIKQILFEANAPVGTTWTNTLSATYSGVTIQDIYSCTMAGEGTTKVVNGVTFNNVIHVSEQISENYMGTAIPDGTADYYYASGIGFIELDATDALGDVTSTTLKSYSIP